MIGLFILTSVSKLVGPLATLEYEVEVVCVDSKGFSVTQVFTLERDTNALSDVTFVVSGDSVLDTAADGTVVGERIRVLSPVVVVHVYVHVHVIALF